MRTYKIPFSYLVKAEIEIEANSLTDACFKVEWMAQKDSQDHVPVLDRATKLVPQLDTLEIDEVHAERINPTTTYKVRITRTQSQYIEVEAHDEQIAEELALSMLELKTWMIILVDEEILVDQVEEI